MNLAQKIIPYLMAGVGLVIMIGAFVILSSLFLWAVVIGLVLFIIVSIKQYFFPTSKPLFGGNAFRNYSYYQRTNTRTDVNEETTTTTERTTQVTGRIIDDVDYEKKD